MINDHVIYDTEEALEKCFNEATRRMYEVKPIRFFAWRDEAQKIGAEEGFRTFGDLVDQFASDLKGVEKIPADYRARALDLSSSWPDDRFWNLCHTHDVPSDTMAELMDIGRAWRAETMLKAAERVSGVKPKI